MLLGCGVGFAGLKSPLNTLYQVPSATGLQNCSRKDPWTVWKRMLCLDFASFDRETKCRRTDAEKLGSLR